MFYDRKIKYLDYYEDGVRVRGGGFVKLEARDTSLRVEVVVSGLCSKDSFTRDIVFRSRKQDIIVGKIVISNGRGQYQQLCQNLKDIDGTGIGYDELQGVYISLGAGRELSCSWPAREQPVERENQRGGKGAESITHRSGMNEGEPETHRNRRNEGEPETHGNRMNEGERETHGNRRNEGERETHGNRVNEREDETRRDGMAEGEGETHRIGVDAKESETRRIGIDVGESETHRNGMNERGDEAHRSEMNAGKKAGQQNEISAAEGERRQSRINKGEEKKRKNRMRVEKGESIWNEMDMDEVEARQREMSMGETEVRQNGMNGGGEKQQNGMSRGEGEERQNGMSRGESEARENGMSVTERNNRKSGITGMEAGTNDRREGRRSGQYAIDRRRENEEKMSNKWEAGREASGNGRREQAEREQSGTQKAEAGKPVKLMEDKWLQLCAIYPHIRPFRDKREYLSIGPADFVLFPAASYKLVNNSFLLHGYYNYHHLILTRLEQKGEYRYYIGVPGSYFEKEKQVAIMFGFESFECESEPAQIGDFGYYMMRTEL